MGDFSLGSVIVRHGTKIVDGKIIHDETIISWEEGDAKAGQRLDRRRNWCFIEDELCSTVSWSQACSGCYEGWEGHNEGVRGMGCRECGYQGRVKNSCWVPHSDSDI